MSTLTQTLTTALAVLLWFVLAFLSLRTIDNSNDEKPSLPLYMYVIFFGAAPFAFACMVLIALVMGLVKVWLFFWRRTYWLAEAFYAAVDLSL